MLKLEVIERKIEDLSILKDNAIHVSDYVLAARIRDELDEYKLQKRQCMEAARAEVAEWAISERDEAGIARVGLGAYKQAMEPNPWGLDGEPQAMESHPLEPDSDYSAFLRKRYKIGLANWQQAVKLAPPGTLNAADEAWLADMARKQSEKAGWPVTLRHRKSNMLHRNRMDKSFEKPVQMKEDAPKEIAPDILAAYQVLFGKKLRKALDKLSGTLSYDNVAAAKQILKKILE